MEKAAKKIISTGQAIALLELMAAFYSDPKNRAAYEKWRAARTKKCPIHDRPPGGCRAPCR